MARPSSSFIVGGIYFKKCPACGTDKPHSEYYSEAGRAHGIKAICKICSTSKAAKWNKDNHERHASNLVKWKAENQDRHAETQRVYHDVNREKKRLAAHLWYINNRDRALANRVAYRVAHKEDELRKMREYWSNNRAMYLAKASRRRAANIASYRPFDEELLKLVEMEAFDLAFLRESITGFKWHVDHIIPITSIRIHSLGGRMIPLSRFCGPKFPILCGFHNEYNLAVIPASENVSKSNRRWPDMP